MSQGKIYLIEGHNYTGKTTLARALVDDNELSSYYHSPEGVNEFTRRNYKTLKESRDVNDETRALLMLANSIVIINYLNTMKDNGFTCVLDRSLLSTFVYQNIEYDNFKELLKYAKVPELNHDEIFILLADKDTVVERASNRDTRVLDSHFMDNMDGIITKYHQYADVIYPDAHLIFTDDSTETDVFKKVKSLL